MLDIDHFKQVNDRHGHPVGDQVITTVAQRLAATLRGTDLLGRYGGEEFAVLLQDTRPDGSAILAERLRAAISGQPIHTDAGPLTVTISIGVADLNTDSSVAELLGRADQALYQAKQGGRNRVWPCPPDRTSHQVKTPTVSHPASSNADTLPVQRLRREIDVAPAGRPGKPLLPVTRSAKEHADDRSEGVSAEGA